MVQEKPIIYQISRYTNNVDECISENRRNKWAMRAKGFVVFNPIDHTHYEERDRTGHPMCPKCQSTDLTWWGPKFDDKHNEILLCMDCNHEFTQKTASYHPLPDYVGEDLAILGAMLKNNGQDSITYNECPHHGPCQVDDQKRCQTHLYGESRSPYVYGKTCMAPTILKTTPLKYDSGVVAEVLPSALDSIQFIKQFELTKGGFDESVIESQNRGYSKGAMSEYLFCRAHHILVISQATAVEIPWEQWRDHAL